MTIASDEQFLERRRRGLTRYLALVANHPILKHDKAVKAFLTETMDFSTWRKIHHEEVQISEHDKNDEASLIGKLSNSQESLIPTTIETIVQTLRESLPELIEGLTRFCSLIERINYRNEMNANDFIRCKLSFDSFSEIYKGLSNSSSGGNSNYSGRSKELDEEILYLNKDLKRFSDEALGKVGERMEIQYRENESELLEGKLKMQRDTWKALFGLLNRYENKLKHDDIEKIKRKIETKQARYTTLQTKRRSNNLQAQAQSQNSNNNTTGSSTPSKEEEEMKKILQEITSYQDDISRLLDRRAFFKWALMAEIRYTWRMSSLIRVDLSDWIGMESRVSVVIILKRGDCN